MDGANNTVDVTVVGIANELGRLSSADTFGHAETIRELVGAPPDSTHVVLARLANANDADAALSRWQNAFAANGIDVIPYSGARSRQILRNARMKSWLGEKIGMNTWQDQLKWLLWRITAANGITAVLLFVLIAVVCTGMVNTMLVAVRKRTREIGTLRALGLSRFRVVCLLVIEGALLGLIFSSIGGVLGGAGAVVLDAMAIRVNMAAFEDVYLGNALQFSVSLQLVVRIVLTFAAATALACVWPALRAARMRPAAALRQTT